MSYKNIMNLHLFDEGGDNGNGGQNAGSGNGGQGSTGGTFTYEQLDEITTSRADVPFIHNNMLTCSGNSIPLMEKKGCHSSGISRHGVRKSFI